MNLSRISAAVATTPQATVAAKSRGHGPLGYQMGAGSQSYVMQVWVSGSYTKTPHLHGSISVSVGAPGQVVSKEYVADKRW